MTTFTRRMTRFTALVAALAAPALLASGVGAQVDPAEPVLSVVIADNVQVRSGAADTYYPFSLLETGDLVLVTGQKFDKWSRVATLGPSFDDAFGFIKYPKTETSRFHLAPDGTSGLTLGRVDILAPNLNSKFSPRDSWKPIARLDADQQIRVLETIESDREIVHRVILPTTAAGWIVSSALSPATPSQLVAWQVAMGEVRFDTEPSDTAATPNQILAQAEPAVKRVVDEGVPLRTDAATTTVAESTTIEIDTPDETIIVEESVVATVTEAKPVAAPPRKPQSIDPELAALEREYEILSGAELTPPVYEIRELQAKYEDLAVRKGETRRIAMFSRARGKQLKIWADLEERQTELAQLRTRVGSSAADASDVVSRMDADRRYVVMGRLAVSRVYDGKKLPKLFRVMEPGTGRTLAYLRAEDLEMVSLLDQLIGIVGSREYDPGLRLTLVTSKRIDLLAPQR